MLKFYIEWRVWIRETLYQWRGQRYDRRRQMDHEATMRFYDKRR